MPIKQIPGGVTAAQGFTASGVHCGIRKNKSKRDLALIWIWYGVVVKDKSIILYQTLFFLIDGSLMAGAILYGAHWI